MGSKYTYNECVLKGMFANLQRHGIYTNDHVVKKIAKLIPNEIKKFTQTFSFYIQQKDFSYNKFELLKLSSSEKNRLDNNNLYRFEYRKKSNMRIVFVLICDNNDIIVVDAFNENGNKTKGKDSYDKAIKNAISNYEFIKEAIYE